MHKDEIGEEPLQNLKKPEGRGLILPGHLRVEWLVVTRSTKKMSQQTGCEQNRVLQWCGREALYVRTRRALRRLQGGLIGMEGASASSEWSKPVKPVRGSQLDSKH